MILRDLVDNTQLVPDALMYQNVIEACLLGGKTEKMAVLVRIMRSKGQRPHADFISKHMEAFGAAGLWQEALDLLQLSDPVDTSGYPALLRGLGQRKQWEPVKEAYEQMTAHGVAEEEAAVRALIKLCNSRDVGKTSAIEKLVAYLQQQLNHLVGDSEPSLEEAQGLELEGLSTVATVPDETTEEGLAMAVKEEGVAEGAEEESRGQ